METNLAATQLMEPS